MDFKKISKTISYWLRHRPDEGGLILDDFGWTPINELLQSLKTSDLEISLNDLSNLNNQGDKKRWIIDLVNLRIKAAHGHSVSIKLEINPVTPEVKIYHGTSVENLWSILKDGILSKSRQYVHLSDSFEMAKVIGSRHGKPILFEIDSSSLIKDGWEFYRTEQNVWLTNDIPASYISLPPFHFHLKQERIDYFLRQLRIEVRKGHKLFEELNDLIFFADYGPREEVYFKNKMTNHIHCVHFTFGATDNIFPATTTYNDQHHWIYACLFFEQDDWFCFKLD